MDIKYIMKKIKLFCIPYSGGAATVYAPWKKQLSESIELYALELAGRGKRIKESYYESVDYAAEDLAKTIISQLKENESYAIYGHSMGALVAFETYYKLQEYNCHEPVHIFFSGRKAPRNSNDKTCFYKLPEAEFIKIVYRYSGNTQEVFKQSELVKIFVPILRADFRISEKYQYIEKNKKLIVI